MSGNVVGPAHIVCGIEQSTGSDDIERAAVAQLRAAGCVFAEDEARLLIAAATTGAELADLLGRRAGGLPLEHLLGWAEFHGLRIAVGPGVFVPRRRTGLAVEQALAMLAVWPAAGPARVVVDMCCGSGAVGTAIAAAHRGARVIVHAADIDPVALGWARRNLAGVPGAGVHQGDLFDALPLRLRGRIDLVVANAPYVPTEAVSWMPPEARDHEPMAALDGGMDGLDVARRVVAQASGWLAPDGHLVVETSASQSSELAAWFSHHGFVPRIVTSEDLDATVVTGTTGLPGVPVASST